ncbi:T9SS type A sorting domain-containing protein [Calditrichota bacterium GD2]
MRFVLILLSMTTFLLAQTFSVAGSSATTITHSVNASLNPQKLLIYYGWPSMINGATNNQQAADTLGQYDFVVLGDGLEKTSHGDHANTVEIINLIHASYSARIFGYIDAGVTTQNLSLSEIGIRIKEWKATGADGIFFDDFGYDFQTSRERQNAVIDSAHAQGLPVCVNAWNPDDVFSSEVNANFNPAGKPTHLSADDFYLSESYQIEAGNYQSEATWQSKADKLDAYQQSIGFGIWSITTNNSANIYDQHQFHYAWHSALLYGHKATGWGEYLFSSNNNSAPFRPRPVIDSGSAFLTAVQHNNPQHSRETNTGLIWIKTDDHSYGFSSSSITIDGNFSDWAGVGSYVTDPQGDYSDANLDLLTGSYTYDASTLFLRTDVAGAYYATANTGDGYHIYIDTDKNAATGLNYGWWSMGADYLVEQVSGGAPNLYQYTGTGSDWSWSFVATLSEAHSGASSEMAIPFSDLGVTTGDEIYIQWASSAAWSDQDYMQDDLGGSRTPAVLGTTSAVENDDLAPQDFVLKQNYPNPFNGITVIEYRLKSGAAVHLALYDVGGRLLKTLVDAYQPAGQHRVLIDMNDLASGVYFYRLKIKNQQATRMMIFNK